MGHDFVVCAVKLEAVQQIQFDLSVLLIDLILFDDSASTGQLGHLSVINFLLHGARSQEAVDVACLLLAKAIHTGDGLHFVGGVP